MELDKRRDELCEAKHIIGKLKNQFECGQNELNEKINCIKCENEKLLCENRTINQRLANIQFQNKQLKSQLKDMEGKFEKLKNGLCETSCDFNKYISDKSHSDLIVKLIN